ncbi:hypothetical protein N6B72_14390 [Chryseobacterium soli]|uniref:hypothetical protein n=1 Tax=Chryseobacterium soli TaxID=445961 RepID=UPI002952C471|nr:hypothetical protein [Chryseobacterium soli]MDV7698113.1 hypothetical protein [Chryseobacterium soli]
MLHKTLLISLGLLTLANCNAQKEAKNATGVPVTHNNSHPTKTAQNKINVIYFNEGENKFLKEYDMNVTFKGISEDSRCPQGVNCIWIGAAVAQVEVMGVATRPTTLSLSTIEKADRNYHQSEYFNGYTISLAEVTPYPTSEKDSKALQGKYRIGIIISKEDLQKGSTTK